MDLNHLNLRVRDAAACRDFYERHFGFRPAFEADGGYFVRNDDGFLLALVPADPHTALPAGFHIGFCVADAAAVAGKHAELDAAGVNVGALDDYRPAEEYVTFRCWDPDGTEIEVFWEPSKEQTDLAPSMRRLLLSSSHVSAVELCGSRASGTSNAYSDWDFAVSARDFAALARELPALVAQLDPLVQQWDRLSDHACYMLIVSGPNKIDLIFDDVPNEHEPPWDVDANTLPRIDDHFWDWVLWLTSKVAAGRAALVEAELEKMYEHLLAPMGVATRPRSLRAAVDEYLAARASWSDRLGVSVSRRVEAAVVPVVESLGRTA